jgi:hypothetical protein
VPTVEGLQFQYVLQPLPVAGWGFRRFGWQLWHGATLVASGWRQSERDAQRALRQHAMRVGHGMFGRPAPPRLGDEPFLTGAVVRVEAGGVAATLVPRALADELAGVAA